MKKKVVARGRPKANEKKKKISARLYASQVQMIKDLGFSGIQSFLDHHLTKEKS